MTKGSRRGFLKSGLATALSPFYALRTPGQANARVRPFLQNLRRHAATINWISTATGDGRVDWTAPGQTARSVKSKIRTLTARETGLTFPLYRHRVDLAGLTQRTPYAYAVFQNDRVLPGCENLTFQTPGQDNTSRMVVLGDSGTGSREQNTLAAMMIARRPDLMLHTGDLVYPSGTVDAYLERFFAPYAPLLERIPVFPCPGNHDYYCEEANFYVALNSLPSAGIPEAEGRYYSFDWENAHFVVLDSNLPLEQAVAGQGKMLEWLEQDLAADRHFWKIAMFHHPPYAGGPNEDDPLSHLARKHIVPILERHGVQLVLNGHEHNYQRSHAIRQGEVVKAGEGIVYLTSGGGGAELYEPKARAEAAFQQGSYHYLEADLRASELQLRAVRVDGVTIDAIALRPKPLVDCVASPADGSEGVAGGGLAAVYGRQLATRENEMAGLTVLVNDQPATMVFAAPDQVSFVLPKGLTGAVKIAVVTANGVAAVDLNVRESAPAVLVTLDENQFRPALFHGNGARVNEASPAQVGEELCLYFTGAGSAIAATVASGEMAVEARIEEVESQPGVQRVFFRVDKGGNGEFRVSAGGSVSLAQPWHLR